MKFYDPDQIVITFAGIRVQCFGEDTFVAIARNENSFALKMGVDGEGTRSKSNNKSGTVTLTLMQTSETNARFSALNELDENTPNGAGVGSLRIRDLNGTTLYSAEQAYLEKPADATFAREASEREWVIATDNLRMKSDGN